MTWVRIDDAAPDHPKLIGLDDEAFALWVRAMCYCARHGTDGMVPVAALRTLTAAKKPGAVAERLVSAGLWERRGVHDCVPSAYEVHDFLDYNPSAEQVKAKRDARAVAGRAGGIRSGQVRSKTEANEEAIASGVASTMLNPVPSRSPDPPLAPPGGSPTPPDSPPLVLEPESGPKRARSKRKAPEIPLPDGWGPKPTHYAAGAEQGLDRAAVDHQSERFKAWSKSKERTYVDWDAAFRNWILGTDSDRGGGHRVGPQRQIITQPEEGSTERALAEFRRKAGLNGAA